jgi:hypothetical protein
MGLPFCLVDAIAARDLFYSPWGRNLAWLHHAPHKKAISPRQRSYAGTSGEIEIWTAMNGPSRDEPAIRF